MYSNSQIQKEINYRYLQGQELFGNSWDEVIDINYETINYLIEIIHVPRWLIPNIIRTYYSHKNNIIILKGYHFSKEFKITKISRKEALESLVIYYSALVLNVKKWFGENFDLPSSMECNEDNVKKLMKTQPIFFLRDTVNDTKIRRI